MNIDVDKYLKKINGKTTNQSNPLKHKYLKSLVLRIIITIIIFLIAAIICKANTKYKDIIYNNVYQKNLSFTKVKSFYNKYLGGIIPFDRVANNIEPVFKENLTYSNKSVYHDGVKLKVEDSYLVPVIESGLVVYVGEKENYGNVIIIQGIDGIDIWYGNMSTTSINMYDYIEKGKLLGETANNYLYLVYSQNGKYLNYEDYLK